MAAPGLRINWNWIDVEGGDSFLSSQPQMDLSDVLKNSQLLLSSVTHFLLVSNLSTTFPL